ncbi:hypothetical protein ACHAWF_015787, partial [Thalassiosira exigua]
APALFDRLERAVGNGSTGSAGQILPVRKRLSIRIRCCELNIDELRALVLEVEFPLEYPSGSACSLRAVNCNGGPPHGDVSARLLAYVESFSGCECLELILDWISENKSICLSTNESASNETAGRAECFVLRYNHLLSGPEHKKEKAMLDAAKKSKLQGGLLWGTPGVVVVVPPSTEEDAREYAAETREIGKRPDGVESLHLPEKGLEEAGLGGLAQQKRGGKLQSMDTATLRIACGGDEPLLRTVLGVR